MLTGVSLHKERWAQNQAQFFEWDRIQARWSYRTNSWLATEPHSVLGVQVGLWGRHTQTHGCHTLALSTASSGVFHQCWQDHGPWECAMVSMTLQEHKQLHCNYGSETINTSSLSLNFQNRSVPVVTGNKLPLSNPDRKTSDSLC